MKDQFFDRTLHVLRTDTPPADPDAQTQAGKDRLDKRKDFLDFADGTVGTFILPFVFDFIVASALELVPVGHDIRRRLAYNLRVLAYEDFGHQAFNAIGLGVDDFVLLKKTFDGTIQEVITKLKAFENPPLRRRKQTSRAEIGRRRLRNKESTNQRNLRNGDKAATAPRINLANLRVDVSTAVCLESLAMPAIELSGIRFRLPGISTTSTAGMTSVKVRARVKGLLTSTTVFGSCSGPTTVNGSGSWLSFIPNGSQDEYRVELSLSEVAGD